MKTRDWYTSKVGKNLICNYTGKMCFCKRKNCIEDCEGLLNKYFVYTEQELWLTEYAEQTYCKTCKVKDCKIFETGDYHNCMKVVMAFFDEG